MNAPTAEARLYRCHWVRCRGTYQPVNVQCHDTGTFVMIWGQCPLCDARGHLRGEPQFDATQPRINLLAWWKKSTASVRAPAVHTGMSRS